MWRQIAALLAGLLPAFAAASPIVIAHRGASGYLPEHTLEAYDLAIEMGADYIEPDLVVTKDGVLIARHEHYLSETTDVASRPEFADRRRRAHGRDDWFTEDFTLAEIRTLRARQSFPGRPTGHDGGYRIPTLQEVIDLALARGRETGRTIGLYPETKVPGHFRTLGFDVATLLLDTLERNGLNAPGAPVFIQSFEPEILIELDRRTELPLVMLLTPASKEMPGTPNMPLEEVADFADGIGASKWLLVDRRGDSTGIIEQARALGLFVHAWTFRDDQPSPLFASPAAELQRYLELGIDGFFTDFPDTGLQVRDAFLQ